MQRADSLEKTLMLGKIEGRRRGRQRMRWLDGITNSVDQCTYVSSLLNLPSTLSHLYRLLQSPGLISLSHTVNFHWLSILHMIVYMFPCYSLHTSHPLLPSPRVHKSVLYVWFSIAVLQINSSVPSF